MLISYFLPSSWEKKIRKEILGPRETGEHMFQNIPEFCTIIWSPWLTGHSWVLRDIRMQRGRMKRENVTWSLSHMKFHHNSKIFFFSPPYFCPQPDPDLIPTLSEGEPVSRQVKHTLNSAGLSVINHCACSFPLTPTGSQCPPVHQEDPCKQQRALTLHIPP